MWTVTVSVSLAEPENDGVVWLEGDSTAFSVTVGEAVLTVNVTVLLRPSELPIELGCVATAVYWPLVSPGLACPELQLLPVPSALALETWVPSALLPL